MLIACPETAAMCYSFRSLARPCSNRHDCDTLSTQSNGDKPREHIVVKIAIIGAGSTVFMKNIVTDIVLEPGLETAHIALHDIDEARLATS